MFSENGRYDVRGQSPEAVGGASVEIDDVIGDELLQTSSDYSARQCRIRLEGPCYDSIGSH